MSSPGVSFRTVSSQQSSHTKEILEAENFNPAEYIRQRLLNVRDGQETRQLKQLRSEMSAVNHEAQESLKNNVFKDYHQFIEASREISHLEREIYQIGSMLAEQKTLLENLLGMAGDDRSSLHTVSSSTTATHQNPVQLLMQRMDGIAGILNNLRPSDRVILFGEMVLLDGETKQSIQKQMLILLNDRLLVGNPSANGKYSLESSFSLNALAAVNVKDRESRGMASADQLIKLLIFPEHRYYRCESARIKKQWLDEIENAKRALLQEGSLQRQATIRGRRQSVQTRAAGLASSTARSPLAVIADDLDENVSINEEETAWLEALPAEVDDCIANRDIEQAVDLVMQWKECNAKLTAVDTQMQQREQQIIGLLSEDIRRPGAVHGGPRAMKKAISLLKQLDRGTYAVDLYLRRRSALQRSACRDVAVSEEPLSYVKQLSALYCTAVADVATEFRSQPEHYCQVLQWCSIELSMLLSLVRRHVIEVAPTTAVLAYTWRILMQSCDELTSMGVQLTFEVNRLLGPSLKMALETNFQNVMHGLRTRMAEEKWRPLILDSESALSRLVEELSDLGLSIEWAIAGRAALNISQHTLHFARVSYTLAKDLEKLAGSPCHAQCDEFMLQIWVEYLQHLSTAKTNNDAHTYSASFTVTQVLSLCEHTYYGEEDEMLRRLLQKEFPALMKFANEEEEEKEKEEEEEEEEEEENEEEEVAHV
ncbi:unnamed protein product, partial [Mesorhabditis belari]|uniref:Exocyst component Exo84 C-terminal domain-containing protein n=1 Tax=Mesorhabditis belari TaxID=2138241 RepID=A0AAF3J7J3_9BILA